MKNFIILSENKIVNIIVAESKEIAESITGLSAMEQLPNTGGNIGDIWEDSYGKFRPEFPMYLGWKFDYDLWRFEPPVPYPSDGNAYLWDNTNLNWKLPGE